MTIVKKKIVALSTMGKEGFSKYTLIKTFFRGPAVISYKPFWDTLKEKNISTYALINIHGISSSTINRLRHDKPVSTTTINDLCFILNCRVEEILTYIAEQQEEH